MSLCLIVGNVSEYIERCLTSFAPIADEIILVRAIGNQEPDDTFIIAEVVCDDLGIPLIRKDYRNAPEHADWPHVDNFAAARQLSFDLASGDYCFWCDTDDILASGAEFIRQHAIAGGQPVWIFPYDIFGRGVSVPRERMIRRGVAGSWKYPVHECFAFDSQTSGGSDERVVVQHLPHPSKTGSMDRNLRILESIPDEELTPGLLYHLHCEQRGAGRTDAAIASAQKALGHPDLGRPEKYELFLNLASMCRKPEVAFQYLLQAYATDPCRREALGLLAATSIDAGRPEAALAYAKQMLATPRPSDWSWNDRAAAYGWIGHDIYQQALRANGMIAEAEQYRLSILKAANGSGTAAPRISLLHATRGRAHKASAARKIWHDLAEHPDRLEHIFAIDADDESSIPLRRFHHVIVPAGGGCVSAWNAATVISTGDILIQLSDDWMPPAKWDTLILERLGDVTQPKVLAVSDGHRTDQLLCMAIATRAYVIQDRFLFHPGFQSVYSDNWFTELAYARGSVIEARDLVFTHDHPAFNKDIPIDDTYARQNAPERYAAGEALLNRLRTGADWSFIPGFFNYITFYDYIADRIPDGATIAEVGVWLGRSVIYLAEALTRRGKTNVRLLAIDHFKGELNQPEHQAVIAQHGGSIRAAFEDNVKRCGFAHMIQIIEGDSADSAALVDDASLAFVYIDAAHDRASVRRDIRAWLPKLKAGGIISGHDAQCPEVADTVRDLIPAATILNPVWFHRIITPLKPIPKLSILTPAIWWRIDQCKKLHDDICDQTLSALAPDDVEHLVLVDNFTCSVGEKRQALLDSARGDYIAFVDDDDEIHEGYIHEILRGIESGADVITFRQRAIIDGDEGEIIFDAKQPHDEPWQPNGIARRRPWHVCAWRRELIQHCKFGDCNYGEDRIWVDQAAPLVKSSHHIDRVLHTYRHNSTTTAAPHPSFGVPPSGGISQPASLEDPEPVEGPLTPPPH